MTEEFVKNNKNSFSFGKVSPTYWIKISLKKMDSHQYREYISIYNPTAFLFQGILD